MQIDYLTDKQTDGQTDRHTDYQTEADRRTDRQADRDRQAERERERERGENYMMLKYDLAAIYTNMHDVKYGVISEHAQFSLVRMMQ